MANLLHGTLIHTIAVKHKPSLPIRPQNLYAAILNHNVTDVKEIKDDTSFTWFKAHPVSP